MKLRLSDTLNSLMLGGLLMASTFASAGNKPTKPYWQDVQVVAVNKEYPRSSFMTYENRANALTGKFEKSKYYQLLNGTWKFYFVDSYKNLPANITDPAISTADWADIKVPGNWEVQGHVSFYARMQHITPRYFSAIIKEKTGDSALQWIVRMVITEAKQLLEESDLSIKEIADQLNFPTQSFFGKYFKQYVGVSPKEYRNNAATTRIKR